RRAAARTAGRCQHRGRLLVVGVIGVVEVDAQAAVVVDGVAQDAVAGAAKHLYPVAAVEGDRVARPGSETADGVVGLGQHNALRLIPQAGSGGDAAAVRFPAGKVALVPNRIRANFVPLDRVARNGGVHLDSATGVARDDVALDDVVRSVREINAGTV